MPPILLSAKPPEDREQLQADWEKDYPGNTQTITRLRDLLISADLELQRADAASQQLQLILDNTSLPAHLWESEELKHLTFLQKRKSQTQRDFYRALSALQACYKSTESKSSPKTNSDPPPPPPLPAPKRGTLPQTIRVRVQDGKTITTPDMDAAFWIEKNVWNNGRGFCRQFHFEDGIIPEEYAYVLTDLGVTYEPCSHIAITYSPEEFERLCKLELETNSPHLLDGERIHYLRHEGFLPTPDEKNQKEK